MLKLVTDENFNGDATCVGRAKFRAGTGGQQERGWVPVSENRPVQISCSHGFAHHRVARRIARVSGSACVGLSMCKYASFPVRDRSRVASGAAERLS